MLAEGEAMTGLVKADRLFDERVIQRLLDACKAAVPETG